LSEWQKPKEIKKRNKPKGKMKIYISGGSGRAQIEWQGRKFSREQIRNALKKLSIDVYYSGSKPSLKSNDTLDFMIAPSSGPSASSQKILDKHDEAELLTWKQFASQYCKKLKMGGVSKSGNASVGQTKSKTMNAKTTTSKNKKGGAASSTKLFFTKQGNKSDLFAVPMFF
jgi:hypothetical protein